VTRRDTQSAERAKGRAVDRNLRRGRTGGALGALRVATRHAAAADVTHVRWRLPRALPAGAKGQVAFQAVLK
jgi:hypothetical protein